MERSLRLLITSGVSRAFGLSLVGPFIFLYFHNILDVSYVEIGIVFAVGSVPALLAVTGGGLLADRFGRRRTYLISLAGEAASLAGVAVAMHAASFLGVFVAMLGSTTMGSLGGPAQSAYIADHATGSARTEGFSWFRVSWNVGFALGVGVAGLMIPFFGFTVATALAAAVVSANFAVLWIALEPSPYDRRFLEPQRPGGPVPAPGGGVRRTAQRDPAPARSPAGSVRASVRVLANDRTFLGFCLASALTTLVMMQWGLDFPLYVQNVLGAPYELIGAGYALNGLVVVFGQTATTRALLGRRLTSIAIAGVLCYVAAFLALAFVPAHAAYLALAFLALVVLITVGENLATIPATVLPSNLAPSEQIGNYNGAYFALTGVGPALAGLLGGYVLGSVGNPLLLWSILVAPAVPGILLMRLVARRMPRTADRA